jgi:hypothetical protein
VRRLTRRGSERARDLAGANAGAGAGAGTEEGAGTGTEGSDREGGAGGQASTKKEGRPTVLRALSLTRRGSKSGQAASPALMSPSTSVGFAGAGGVGNEKKEGASGTGGMGLLRRLSSRSRRNSKATGPVVVASPSTGPPMHAGAPEHARAVALVMDMRGDGGGEAVGSSQDEDRDGHAHLRPGAPAATPIRPSRSKLRKSHVDASAYPHGERSSFYGDGDGHAHAHSHGHHDGNGREVARDGPYPLLEHLAHPGLFASLLSYLSYGDWAVLLRVVKVVGMQARAIRPLTEVLLVRFLGGVGYRRWPDRAGVKEGLVLTVDVRIISVLENP